MEGAPPLRSACGGFGEGELVRPHVRTSSPPLWGVAPSIVIPADCFVRPITHLLGMGYVVLDDALPPIRSTGMKEIPLALIDRKQTRRHRITSRQRQTD